MFPWNRPTNPVALPAAPIAQQAAPQYRPSLQAPKPPAGQFAWLNTKPQVKAPAANVPFTGLLGNVMQQRRNPQPYQPIA